MHFIIYMVRLLLAVVISSLTTSHALVVRTTQHQLVYIIAENHDQIKFLEETRTFSPELIFWSGIATIEEKIYILATGESIEKHTSSFGDKGLKFTKVYDTVEITYVEDNPDHPNKVPVETHLGQVTSSSENDDDDDGDDSEEIEANLEDDAAAIDDQTQAEALILQRNYKLRENAGTLETTAKEPLSPGLLEVKKMVGITGMTLPIYQGLLYRIQGMQTLEFGNKTSAEDGEWEFEGEGLLPLVGEHMSVSFHIYRDGNNPYITAEEGKYFKNEEYEQNKTKSALWMFVPTEREKFYEIRNRNYPMSLLVWVYDKDEGEFILGLETRRNYMRRYQADGDLRIRALFALEMISETYSWELRHNRPKFYLQTYNQNHVYLYESTKKHCSVLVVRNTATNPYAPLKTQKTNRPLDMFYITRTNLTGKFTGSIHSFLYDKTIVDAFADSATKGLVRQLSEIDMVNRGPISTTQYLHEEISNHNNFTFHFRDSLSSFQWVTIESHLPSFGIAPMIHAGVMKGNTDTKVVSRQIFKTYKIQDKIMLSSGESINASTIFQYTEGFSNSFSALMEVTEPAERLMWDRTGKPRYVRLSLPGELIEHNWHEKANFHYERVIEKREVAFVVQIKGKMVGDYGLRGFVKKTQLPFTAPMEVCEDED